jgi:hypothetical protein
MELMWTPVPAEIQDFLGKAAKAAKTAKTTHPAPL